MYQCNVLLIYFSSPVNLCEKTLPFPPSLLCPFPPEHVMGQLAKATVTLCRHNKIQWFLTCPSAVTNVSRKCPPISEQGWALSPWCHYGEPRMLWGAMEGGIREWTDPCSQDVRGEEGTGPLWASGLVLLHPSPFPPVRMVQAAPPLPPKKPLWLLRGKGGRAELWLLPAAALIGCCSQEAGQWPRQDWCAWSPGQAGCSPRSSSLVPALGWQ